MINDFLPKERTEPHSNTYFELIVLSIAYSVLIALVLSPFIFFGRITLDTSDAVTYYQSVFYFYSKAVTSGDSFLWAPSIFSGFPIYLSQVAGFLDPVNYFLYRFLPPITAFHIRLGVDFLLVCIFSYYASRTIGLSRTASLLVGPSYLLAFRWKFLFNPIVTNTLFLLPFLLYIFFRAIRSEKKWWAWSIAGGLGVGWTFIAGYAQIVLYAFVLLGLFSVLFFFFVQKAQYGWRPFFKSFIVLFTIVIVAGFAGIPQIVPALSFSEFTFRNEPLTYQSAVLKAFLPGDFVYFVFPGYFHLPFLGEGGKVLYTGAMWFFLAVLGAGYYKKNRTVAVFAVLFFITLILAFRGSPLFYFLHQLPLFESFRFPERWLYLGSWFLSILGAYGLDAILQFAHEKWVRYSMLFLGICTGIVALVVLMFNFLGDLFWGRMAQVVNSAFLSIMYGRGSYTKDPAHYLGAFERLIGAWRNEMSLFDPMFGLPFFVLLAAFFILSLFVFGKIRQQGFRIGVIFISVLTFLGVFAVQWQYTGKADDMIFQHATLIKKFVGEDDQVLYRTFPFLPGRSARAVMSAEDLSAPAVMAEAEKAVYAAGSPNMNMYAEMASVDGYDVFIPRVYFDALVYAGSSFGGDTSFANVFGTAGLSRDELISRLLGNADILGMMAGKYVISGVPLDGGPLRFLGEYPVSTYQFPLYVYENPFALPRWYFASKEVFIPHESPRGLIDGGMRDFQHETYIDCGSCMPELSDNKEKPVVVLRTYKNARREFVVETYRSHWFVLSESFLPGWEAAIDGMPVDIKRANGLYMAVEVPKGVHSIEFRYEGMYGEARVLRALGVIRE